MWTDASTLEDFAIVWKYYRITVMLRDCSHSHALWEELSLLKVSRILGEHVRKLWKGQLSAGLSLGTCMCSSKTPQGESTWLMREMPALRMKVFEKTAWRPKNMKRFCWARARRLSLCVKPFAHPKKRGIQDDGWHGCDNKIPVPAQLGKCDLC